jgi:hypothetical protein
VCQALVDVNIKLIKLHAITVEIPHIRFALKRTC